MKKKVTFSSTCVANNLSLSLSLDLSHALTSESTNGGGDDLSPSFVQQYPFQHGHQLNKVEVVQLTVTIL